MTVENATLINQLNTAWPLAADLISEGDDHLRLLKLVLRTNFPNIAGVVTPTHLELNYVAGVTSALQAQLDAKAPLASPTLTGVVTVPTRAVSDSTTAAASTAFVQGEFGSKLPGLTAPITATSAEINRLAGVSAPVQGQIDGKGSIAGQTWSGAHNFAGASGVTLPAATSIGTVTAAELGQLAGVTAPLQTQINAKGAIAGQAWTGAHSFVGAAIDVPTQSIGDATNKAASTAFVAATSFAGALPGQAGNAGKFVKTDGSAASWAFPTLDAQVITSNTAAISGVRYVIAEAGITLDASAAPSKGDVLSVREAIGSPDKYTINFGANKVRGNAVGSLLIDAKFGQLDLTYEDATRGYI